jgi:hypothetical protein
MKKYQHVEPGPDGSRLTITVSDRYILMVYWHYWSARMAFAGKRDQVSQQSCIDDWCVVHWATEL